MRRDKRYWFKLLGLILAEAICITLLIILVLAYGLGFLLAHPPRAPISSNYTPRWYGLRYEEVSFRSADGFTLSGWYIPSQNGAVVIFCHGWGGNRTWNMSLADILAKHGYGTLLFDFFAHGQSEGEFCSLGPAEVNDLLGAIEYLKTRSDVDPGRIGAIGWSMGGDVAILTAAVSQDLRAIVVDGAEFSRAPAPLRNARDVPRYLIEYLQVKVLELETGVSYSANRPVDKVAAISPRPILFIYGIDIEAGRQLHKATREPKELWHIGDVGHIQGFKELPEAYAARILTFFDEALATSPD